MNPLAVLIKKAFNVSVNFSVKLFAKDLWKYLFEKGYKDSREWYYKWNKEYKPQLRLDHNLKDTVLTSNIPIDILITCLPKDIDVLPLTLRSIKENIKHPIGSIYIVSPKGNEIEIFCRTNNCKFIDEMKVLGFDKTRINYKVNGLDRSGWLLQQLLKLSGDTICDNEHFLVIDADTLFIKPRTFKVNTKTIIDFSDEYHLPYFRTYEKLLNLKHVIPVSFICHYMLFEKNKLRSLKQLIEQTQQSSWHEAILNAIEHSEASSFSEFETYANFVLEKYKGQHIIEYWFNKSLSKTDNTIENDITTYSKNYKTISYHTYNN